MGLFKNIVGFFKRNVKALFKWNILGLFSKSNQDTVEQLIQELNATQRNDDQLIKLIHKIDDANFSTTAISSETIIALAKVNESNKANLGPQLVGKINRCIKRFDKQNPHNLAQKIFKKKIKSFLYQNLISLFIKK